MLMWFLILETYGFPVAWHKVKARTRIEGVGYQLEVSSFEVGISDRKREWLLSWLDSRLKEGGVVGRNLRATLGRFCFVARALDHSKPFLSPGFRMISRVASECFPPLTGGHRSTYAVDSVQGRTDVGETL